MASQRTRQGIERALRYATLLLVGLTVGPFLWLLSTSLKGAGENIYAFPPSLLPRAPTLANYGKVFESQPFFTYLLNSSLVASLSVPQALEEVALIEGVSRLRIWWHVMLPLVRPSLATLAVFSFSQRFFIEGAMKRAVKG